MSISKIFLVGLMVVITVGAGSFFVTNGFVRNKCGAPQGWSLTPAAAHFADRIEKRVDEAFGGHPVEGYEPQMILDAHTRLAPADFTCVQTSGGYFEEKNGGLVFVSTAPRGVKSTADRAITSYGMARLLENVAGRLQMPLTTTTDSDAIYAKIESEGLRDVPKRTTLVGVYMCLPHVNTKGPQTEECAFGMKSLSGDYYALDFMLMSQNRPNLSMGNKIEVTGLLTPVEQLSSDRWKKYPIKGIMSVTDSVIVIK